MSCFVLDASALFHGRDLRLFQGSRLLTTKYVLEEIKDVRAQ
ncbi:MAG: PIN domain nuclease, partial [Thermoproteus sp.]